MKKSIYAVDLFTHQRGIKHVKVFQRDPQRAENRIEIECESVYQVAQVLMHNKQGGESLHYQLTATKSGVINSLLDRQLLFAPLIFCYFFLTIYSLYILSLSYKPHFMFNKQLRCSIISLS